MRPGIGLCNRLSPRNGSRTYLARRITPSTASEIVVIAATIVTSTKVLVTADAAMSAGSRGLPARGERLRAACWIRPRRRYRPALSLMPHSGRGIVSVQATSSHESNVRSSPRPELQRRQRTRSDEQYRGVQVWRERRARDVYRLGRSRRHRRWLSRGWQPEDPGYFGQDRATNLHAMQASGDPGASEWGAIAGERAGTTVTRIAHTWNCAAVSRRVDPRAGEGGLSALPATNAGALVARGSARPCSLRRPKTQYRTRA